MTRATNLPAAGPIFAFCLAALCAALWVEGCSLSPKARTLAGTPGPRENSLQRADAAMRDFEATPAVQGLEEAGTIRSLSVDATGPEYAIYVGAKGGRDSNGKSYMELARRQLPASYQGYTITVGPEPLTSGADFAYSRTHHLVICEGGSCRDVPQSASGQPAPSRTP